MTDIDWRKVPKQALIDALRNSAGNAGLGSLSHQDKPDLIDAACRIMATGPDYAASFKDHLDREIAFRREQKPIKTTVGIETMDDIVEKFSRAIDPRSWNATGDNVPRAVAASVERARFAARQRANEAAQRVIDSMSLADLDALKELFPYVRHIAKYLMTHDIRRWITLLNESENILDREALGSIIQVQPESDFGATTWYMKFADGTWRPILNFTYLQNQPYGLYRGDDPVDPQALLSALAAKRVGRPVEGLHLGDHITASVQMHALPDGAIIVNPQTGSVYHKKDGHFFDKDSKDLPADVFRFDNARWKK